MATFALSNFTGSAVALNAYTPDTGGAFTRNQGTNIPYIGQQTSPDIRNMLGPSGTGSQQSHWSQNSAAAATADYFVPAVMKYIAPGIAGQKFGIGGRGNAAAGTGYYFGWDEDAQAWRLGRLGSWAGGLTSLATAAATLVDGQSYSVVLSMIGTAIKGWVDNVAVCSVTDATFATGNRACVIDLGTGHQALPGASSGISGLFMDSHSGVDTIAAPSNSVAPVASGTGTVGQTLSCTTGTWTGSPAFAYQWKRDGANIGGATSSTYLLDALDAGTTVTCTVTGTNPGGTASATSNGIAVDEEEEPGGSTPMLVLGRRGNRGAIRLGLRG